jgi:cation diffusion facilitator family transporter
VFSAWEGVRALAGGGHELTDPVVSFIVLAVAFVLEGVSWTRAVHQVRHEAAADRRPLMTVRRHNDDPTVSTVLLEDSAALIGLVLAAAGIGLHVLTGSFVWDAGASLGIAAVLAFVAFRLARTNRRLLVGAQADVRLVRAIEGWLREQPGVDAVVDLLTVQTGADMVLVCARLDFADDLDASGVERAALTMDEEMRERFPDVAEVFLEPVPRNDESVRARVRQRYGDVIADRLARPSQRGAADGTS